MAEKAIWDYQDKNGKHVEIVTICPGVILGASHSYGASAKLIIRMLDGSVPGIIRLNMPCVGVEETAEAHVKAALVPEAANERFILVNESCWVEDMCNMLRPKYGDDFKIPSRRLPYNGVWLASWWDPEVARMIRYWDSVDLYDNSKSKNILGLEYGSLEDQICGMAEDLKNKGIVKPKK